MDRLAKKLGAIGAALCGLLILAIVATTGWMFALGNKDSMHVFMILFAFMLPLASIPVGLFCMVGAVLSSVALRRRSSAAARTGLWLSLAGPLAVIVCYGAC